MAMKLSKKEAEEFFRQNPTPQTQYSREAGPTREDYDNRPKEQPAHEQPSRQAPSRPQPARHADLSFAGVGQRIQQGAAVLRKIPAPSWISSGVPGVSCGGSAPSWLNSGIGVGTPVWLNTSPAAPRKRRHSRPRQQQQPRSNKPAWIQW
jgi:hypothetical protein